MGGEGLVSVEFFERCSPSVSNSRNRGRGTRATGARVKLGIFGASGFVGSALCERLYFEREFDFVCFVRSTGNAGASPGFR